MRGHSLASREGKAKNGENIKSRKNVTRPLKRCASYYRRRHVTFCKASLDDPTTDSTSTHSNLTAKMFQI